MLYGEQRPYIFDSVLRQRLNEPQPDMRDGIEEFKYPFIDAFFDPSFLELQESLQGIDLVELFHVQRAINESIERLGLARIMPFENIRKLQALPMQAVAERTNPLTLLGGLGKLGENITLAHQRLSRSWVRMQKIAESERRQFSPAFLFKGIFAQTPQCMNRRDQLLWSLINTAAETDKRFSHVVRGLRDPDAARRAMRSMVEREKDELSSVRLQLEFGI